MGLEHDRKKVEETIDLMAQKPLSRRQFLRFVGLSSAAVGVGGGAALLSGCGGSETTTTTAAAAGTTATTTATATTAGAAPGAPIKMGYLSDYAIPPNVNSRKVFEAIVEGANARGGWDVGGEKRMLELITYDTKSDPNTARSAVERLVSDDKVDVVFGDATASAWVSVTEGANTLAVVETALPDIYKPEYKLTFGAAHAPIQTPALLGGLPEYIGRAIKKFAVVFSDDPIGQIMSEDVAIGLKAFGAAFDMVSFPPTTSDFAAVATKILAANADGVVFNVNNQALAQIMRALNAASYSGVPIMLHELAPGEVGRMIPLEELEGLVAGIVSWSTDNPVSVAKELKDDYIAKYGEWDDPGFTDLDVFYTYREAVLATGSTQADAVAGVLAGGFQFEGPHGPAKMIARPDMGVADRTVCAIMEIGMCTMQGGRPQKLQTVPLADVEKYATEMWAGLKP